MWDLLHSRLDKALSRLRNHDERPRALGPPGRRLGASRPPDREPARLPQHDAAGRLRHTRRARTDLRRRRGPGRGLPRRDWRRLVLHRRPARQRPGPERRRHLRPGRRTYGRGYPRLPARRCCRVRRRLSGRHRSPGLNLRRRGWHHGLRRDTHAEPVHEPDRDRAF